MWLENSLMFILFCLTVDWGKFRAESADDCDGICEEKLAVKMNKFNEEARSCVCIGKSIQRWNRNVTFLMWL